MGELNLVDGELNMDFEGLRADLTKGGEVIMVTAFDGRDKTVVNYWLNKEEAEKVVNYLKYQFNI